MLKQRIKLEEANFLHESCRGWVAHPTGDPHNKKEILWSLGQPKYLARGIPPIVTIAMMLVTGGIAGIFLLIALERLSQQDIILALVAFGFGAVPMLAFIGLVIPLRKSHHYHVIKRIYRHLTQDGVVSYGTITDISPNAQRLDFECVSEDGQRIIGSHQLAQPHPELYAGDTVVVLHDGKHGVLL